MAYLDRLWTFQDATERVLDTFGLEREGRDLRQARLSVLDANREIPNWGDWQWMMSKSAFTTEAVYSTGTAAYTHATRTCTLTDGVWPANAAFGNVVLIVDGQNIRMPVESRTSDTVVVIGSSINPGEDIAAGTSFQWFRDEYEIPPEAHKNFDLFDLDNEASPHVLRYVSEAAVRYEEHYLWFRWYSLELNVPLPVYEEPQWYTIARTDKYDSGFSLRFAQIPETARRYELTYWKTLRPLRYEKTAIPDVTTTVDSPTVTSAGTEFVAGHVGTIMRFSANTAMPSNIWGGIDTNDTVNMFTFQARVLSFETTSSITLDRDAPETLTNVAAIISDPIEVDHEIMLDMLLHSAEAFMARRQNRNDYSRWDSERMRSIRLAREFDEDFRKSRGNHIYGQY